MTIPAVARRRAGIGWLVAALVLALAGTGGFYAWRTLTDPIAPATAAAERAARALTDRTITDGAFGTTAGPAEAADLAATLRGMGGLRPAIAVMSVQPADDQQRATARLRAEWTIHAGKPPWVQEAYLRLVRGPQGWTAVWSRELIASGLDAGDRLRAVRLAPERGEILGADGERLVWNAEAKRIGLDKTLVDAAAQPDAVRRLAEAVGIDADGFAAKVRAYGPRAFVEATVVRAVGAESWATLSRVAGVPGVRVLDTVRPLASSTRFARQLLGSVGEATAEIIAAGGGRIRTGDLVGLGGIQKVRNDTLMGVTGFVVQAYPDGHAEQARELFTVPAVPGEDLQLTLDAARQRAAETLLGSSGKAALVAVRPSDGAVLVLASTPGSTAATSQRLHPERFPPVTVLAARRPGGRAEAVEALGLTGDAGLGVPVFLSATDGDVLRVSPFALAAAAMAVAADGGRPRLFADRWPAEVAGGITTAEARAVRREMRKDGRLRAGERTWAVVVQGDLAVAGYRSDGGAASLVERFLRRAG